MSIFGGSAGSASQQPRIKQLHIQGAQYNVAIPLIYGQARVPGNVIWANDLLATQNSQSVGKGGGTSTTTTTYTAAGIFAFGQGPIAAVIRRWTDGAVHKSHAWAYLSANGWLEFLGTQGQAAWAYLTSNHPGLALGYSLIAYVAQPSVPMGSSPNFPQYTWEIAGLLQYGGAIVDAEPSAVINDLLNHSIRGLNLGITIQSTQLRNYCIASGTFFSPVLDQQKTGAEWLRMLFEVCHADAVWSEGMLKTAPYFDQTITGNGVTFTPNLTPAYTLTDDDLVMKGRSGSSPITVTRKSPQDRYNSVLIEFVNRGNDYKIEVAEAKSQGDIDTYSLKRAPTKQFHPIMSPALAKWVAQLKLVQGLTARNTYKFNLSQRHILLDPLVDIVAISRPELGLSNYPVRVTSITEDPKTGILEVEAEDLGTNYTPGYATQPTSGTVLVDGGQTPQPVNTPAIFEPTSTMLGGIPAIWIGASGQNGNLNWGGCHIWYSEDGGSTYTQIGEVDLAATQGTLLSNLNSYGGANPDTGDTLAIDLSESAGSAFGSLVSISNTLADQYNNLCWVDGEFLAFTTQAAGASPDQYNLTRLNRGLFDTTAGSHLAGAQFCFLNVLQNADPAVFKWQYPTRLIGKTLMFKFTSFNQQDSEEQDISTVTAYSYTVLGTAFTSGVGAGASSVPVGFGIAQPWAAAVSEALGNIVIDSHGNGQQCVSIGGIEWNYNSSTSGQPGLALVDYPWAPVGAVPAQTQSLSGSNGWVGQSVALNPLGTITAQAVGAGTDQASGTNVKIAVPAGVQAGWVMVAQIVVHDNAISSTAGWTLIRSDHYSTGITSLLFYKIASSSEPASYTWILGASAASNGSIIAYSNVNTLNPVQTSAGNTGSSTAPNAPSVTTGFANNQILNFYAWASSAQLTISAQTGSSTPSWNTTIGGLTMDASITWENVGPMVAYNTWQAVASTAITMARKSDYFTVSLDGQSAYSNLQPGDRVHVQILNGTTVIASGRVSFQAGSTTSSAEGMGALFSRGLSGYSGTLNLTAQVKAVNGSGSGTFSFALDSATLTAAPKVNRAVAGT